MITKRIKCSIPLMLFLLLFLYSFLVYDVSFHGPDEPIYYAYTASVVNDGDLNIVNNQTPLNFDQFSVSKTYNFPVFHNYGGVILWAPFYTYAKFVYFIAEKLNITDITLYGPDMLARCVMSLSTVVFGIIAIFLSYMFCSIFFSAGIVLYSIGALFLGTPFFYYLLFEGGNANVVACLFAVLSIWFFFYAVNFKKLHWFLYGLFFSLAVAVKTELWFQILFIIPFFLFLAFSKRIVWKNGLYLIAGYIPVFVFRAINAYLKYGTVHLEEVIYLRSVFRYQPSYCFNGFFSSYRGIFYTSPVLYICLLGFVFVIFRMLRNFKEKDNKKHIQDIFFAMLACYVFVKLVLVGKIFSPAGGEMSIRVLMAEFPVFVILFAHVLPVLKKYIRYFWPSIIILFIIWNLLIVSEHLIGLEWAYIAGAPNILVRLGSLSYVLDFLFNANNLLLKLKICSPLIILIFGTAYLGRVKLSSLVSSSSQLTLSLMKAQYLKLFSLFTVYSSAAFLFITMLNIFNNKSNVEKLQTDGFFKNAKIIEVFPFKMTAIEKEQHLMTLFKMMRYYAEKGDFDSLQHIKEFRNKYYGSDESVYSLFPRPVKQYYKLAESYSRSGRYKEAIDCYEKAIELNPGDLDAFISLGDTCVVIGEYNRAIEIYKIAMQRMPNSINLCQRLADTYNKVSNFEEAIYCYQQYIEFNPRSFYGYANLGDIYFLQGNYTKAMEYYQKGIEANPYAIEGYGKLGDIYFICGKYQEAIGYYQKVIERVPNSVDVYSNIADAYEKIGSYIESVEYVKKALEFNPSSIDLYERLGNSYSKMRKYEQAIDCFQKVIEINPQLVEGYRKLGDIYFIRSKYEKAIEYYQEVIKRVPNSVDVYFSIADAYDKLGSYEQRIMCLNKALEIAPRSVEIYEKLGDAYNQVDKHQEAIAVFQEIIRLNPARIDAYINIAYIYNYIGNYDDAIKYYLQTINLQPDYAEAYSDLGQIYYDNREYDKAIYYFNKFTQFNPNNPDIIYGLGDAYIGKGDKKNALKQVIKLRELKRNDLADDLEQETGRIVGE